MPTPKELFTGLRINLKALTWPGSANRIFGDEVYIIPSIDDDLLARTRIPCAYIQDQGAVNYPYHNQLLNQNFSITVYTNNFADGYSEGAMVSANRPANSSRGVGFLDIDEALIENIHQITELDSNKTTLQSKSKIQTKVIRGAKPWYFRNYSYTTLVTTDTSGVPDTEDILRMPGFLYWNPTDLGDAPAGYGDNLGYLRDGIIVDPNISTVFLTEEETGDEPQHAIYTGTYVKAVANLFNYNSTTLARLSPGLSSSNQIRIPDTQLAGKDFYSDSAIFGRLLFVPDDIANNMVFILQKCAPQLVKGINILRGENIFYQCQFVGTRKTNDVDGLFYLGPIGSAVLR